MLTISFKVGQERKVIVNSLLNKIIRTEFNIQQCNLLMRKFNLAIFTCPESKINNTIPKSEYQTQETSSENHQ